MTMILVNPNGEPNPPKKGKPKRGKNGVTNVRKVKIGTPTPTNPKPRKNGRPHQPHCGLSMPSWLAGSWAATDRTPKCNMECANLHPPCRVPAAAGTRPHTVAGTRHWTIRWLVAAGSTRPPLAFVAAIRRLRAALSHGSERDAPGP